MKWKPTWSDPWGVNAAMDQSAYADLRKRPIVMPPAFSSRTIYTSPAAKRAAMKKRGELQRLMHNRYGK